MNIQSEEQMQELLPIAAKLAGKYTGGMSTSVTWEKAQELMEAVLYCIREYEQEQADGYAPAPAGGVRAEEVYQRGFELVVRKVKKMQAFYNRLARQFCSYGCKSLEDVMEKGFPEFFRRYDARFAPQHTLLTLDYPTILPVEGCSGIDAVEQYLGCLSLEQKFLGAFDETYVRNVLSSYDWNYREQFFNLCGVLLEHILGCILMGKPLQEPADLTHRDRLEQWTGTRSGEEMHEELSRIVKKLSEERFRGNELLYEYLSGALPDITVRLRESGAAAFSWML